MTKVETFSEVLEGDSQIQVLGIKGLFGYSGQLSDVDAVQKQF